MHKTLFSRELRLLLCPQCGAPIEGTIAGGSVACRYCRATAIVAPRDESRDMAIAAVQSPVSEAERFQRLREQDHKPLLPPPALQHLVVNGTMPPELVPQALGEFQRARQEMASGNASFGATERLYFVTLLLYGALSRQGKDAEVRALLETARDLLSDPRHRQVLHGMLARNASRVGDPSAAEEWLRLCNARAADIQMDTAYRFSRAYVSTRAGDYQTVLQVLGTRIDDVPIADGQDEICALLRANALERTGQLQAAVEQIVQISSGEPGRAQLVDQIAAANPELALCPQSLAAARAQAASMMASAVRTKSSFNIGAIIGFAVGGVVIGLVLDFAAWAIVPSDFIGAVHTVIIIGTIGVSFLATFGGIAKAKAAKQKLLQEGVLGRARVMSANGTGITVNDEPMLELQLQVQLPGRAPYIAIHREIVGGPNMMRTAMGSSLAVRVHPSDPTQMAVDWQQP
jgi:DNA-directed RNA polymerase subunit RPC12/RpoP